MLKQICLLILSLSVGGASVVQLNDANVKSVLAASKFSFVNFYADWCHFSQALSPIIEEVGKKLKQEFPDDSQLIVGKVDCDREVNLAQSFKVNKYPTMKVFRFGQMQKREYRGQRSVEAISEFIRTQLAETVIRIEKSESEPTDAVPIPLEKDQGGIVGFFTSNNSTGFVEFSRVASMLRDDCKFISVVGIKGEPEKIVFQKGQPDVGSRISLPKPGEDSLKEFVMSQCVPLVREITFQNAEELTEEGLPFFILFYPNDDSAIVDSFKSVVERHLSHHRRSVNFLTGQGAVFSHPLHHLGKTVSDLPVVAIDSFKHMYVFPHDVRDSLQNHPERFSDFVADLQSGKLHREFHHGPDPTTAASPQHVEVPPEQPGEKDHAPRTDQAKQQPPSHATSPPKSVFKNLSPSRNRYTILRDEL
uniref:Thioredoxin domain-containing protein n=1 Tax=Macrostomum lignano TaxID=282301 RepID=A0A1I8J1B3_9PLAT